MDVLREKCGLEMSGRAVLVGVSGGADSLSLLHWLHAAHYPLVCAIFDHGLRPEAEQEVEHVRRIAEGLGSAFVTARGDVAAYAEAEGLSTEEAARTLRYRFLFRAARDMGAQAVAVGHTADDQAETVLMHFLRGAGLAGLKGMTYRSVLPIFDAQIPLVRPLLGWSRAETERYCRENGLAPIQDPSNTDITYFRNRLRHELIPQLESYNPRIRETLVRTALALQGDDELLAQLVETAWQACVREQGEGFIGFGRDALEELPAALRRNLFRRAATLLRPGLRNIDFEALERASTLKALHLGGGLQLFVEAETIYLASYEADLPSADWPQVAGGQASVISSRSSVDSCQFRLANGWLLTCEQGALDAGSWQPDGDEWSVWLDAEVTEGRLDVRRMRQGDRFQPLGMGGKSVKVQDFFVNIKLPRRARANWPLVCMGDEIAWVGGLRVAHPFRITGKTRRAYHLTLQKN